MGLASFARADFLTRPVGPPDEATSPSPRRGAGERPLAHEDASRPPTAHAEDDRHAAAPLPPTPPTPGPSRTERGEIEVVIPGARPMGDVTVRSARLIPEELEEGIWPEHWTLSDHGIVVVDFTAQVAYGDGPESSSNNNNNNNNDADRTVAVGLNGAKTSPDGDGDPSWEPIPKWLRSDDYVDNFDV